MWECLCECGEKRNVTSGNLRSGNTKSCGCDQARKPSPFPYKNLTGKTFGRLTVLSPVRRDVWKWLCICTCGNTTEVQTSNLGARGGTQSCGCLRADKNRERCGDKHYNWKPELTPEEREQIRTKEYKAWRTKVYIRDNYKCALCGVRGGRLHAHHKDGYNWCRERRYDITNGETLCVYCHTLFHTVYGKGNNTEEQWEEFLVGLTFG